jgi:hypothetical protein
VIRTNRYINPSTTSSYNIRLTFLTMTATEKSKAADSNIIIENFRLGVWNLKIATTSGHMLVQWLTDIKSAVPLFYRLCSDIFALSPRLFTSFVLCQIWRGVEGALSMHFSSLLLRRVCHDTFRGLSIQYMGSRLRKVSSQENLMLQRLYPQQQSALHVRF